MTHFPAERWNWLPLNYELEANKSRSGQITNDPLRRQEHVNRFHERKAQYLAGEPRVEFFSLHVGKGVPQPQAQRP